MPPPSSIPPSRPVSSSTSTWAARRTSLDRARRSGAARFVHVSSNSPFGVNASPDEVFTEDSPYDPYLGYGLSKYEAEQLVQRAHDRGDVPTVMVRAPWFYGPYQPPRQ